jgi:hypothetical protein
MCPIWGWTTWKVKNCFSRNLRGELCVLHFPCQEADPQWHQGKKKACHTGQKNEKISNEGAGKKFIQLSLAFVAGFGL